MKRPTFCILLDLGIWACVFGAVCGLLCIVSPSSDSYTRLIGLAALFNSMILTGLQMGVVWIVEALCEGRSAPPELPDEKPDWI